MGKNYTYKLVGYDKEDKEKELEFFAPKNLRKDVFLLMYYSEDKE